jgi:hypothetical protein
LRSFYREILAHPVDGQSYISYEGERTMRPTLFAATLAVLVATGAAAQMLKLPPALEALSRAASETVDVTMDSSMIRFAERFLSDRDPDQAKAKRILRGLNAIYVRTFEFSTDGAYSTSDLNSMREQLRAPGWSRMVEARDGKENVEVFTRTRGGEVDGMVVVAAEPKELTIVQIDGPIRPEELASLSGRVGLPRIRIGGIK